MWLLQDSQATTDSSLFLMQSMCCANGPSLRLDWKLCRPAQHEALPAVPLLLHPGHGFLHSPLPRRNLQMLRFWQFEDLVQLRWEPGCSEWNLPGYPVSDQHRSHFLAVSRFPRSRSLGRPNPSYPRKPDAHRQIANVGAHKSSPARAESPSKAQRWLSADHLRVLVPGPEAERESFVRVDGR